MAELERLTCHLDTIAATAEAAGFAAVANRCALHGEALRRAALIAFGHRLLMDCVVPGGVVADITPGGGEGIARAVTALAAELPELARASWTGRLAGIGAVSAAMAAPLPGGGVVGRAGDAATRTEARLAELGESARLLRNRLAALPDGAVAATLPVESGEGVGLADGPAGDVWHWLRLDHGQIASVFMRDPAWVHWHLLEAVMTGCSLDDLPVVLASFGLSSSAVDL
jgi:Ni,Fe-hydrogenase III large subunit